MLRPMNYSDDEDNNKKRKSLVPLPMPTGGGGGSGGGDDDDQTAAEVPYNNGTSGLTADTVQAAIDEVAAAVSTPDAAAVDFDATGLDNTSATEVQTALEDFDAAISAAGGADALNDLSDVTITSPAVKQSLRHNGTAWVNTLGPNLIAWTVADAAARLAIVSDANDPGRLALQTDDNTVWMLMVHPAATPGNWRLAVFVTSNGGLLQSLLVPQAHPLSFADAPEEQVVTLVVGSTLTADRELMLVTPDADATLTITGNATIPAAAPAASVVTFDDTGLAIITTVNVQDALEELDAAVDGLSGGGGSGLTAPPTTGWTWRGQDTASINSSGGIEYLSEGTASGTGIEARLRTRAVPVLDYTLEISFKCDMPPHNFTVLGIALHNSSSGATLVFGLSWQGTRQPQIGAHYFSNLTTYGSAVFTARDAPEFCGGRIFFKLVVDLGVTRSLQFSVDRVNWREMASVSDTAVFVADEIGFGGTFAAVGGMGLDHWILT